jgi:hypothetical protein
MRTVCKLFLLLTSIHWLTSFINGTCTTAYAFFIRSFYLQHPSPSPYRQEYRENKVSDPHGRIQGGMHRAMANLIDAVLDVFVANTPETIMSTYIDIIIAAT